MKPKNTSRMSLNKVTVANLEKVEMNEVIGGTDTGYTCVYCNTDMSCIDPEYRCLWQESCPPTCSR